MDPTRRSKTAALTLVVLDLTDLVLADRGAVRLLRHCETGERMVLRNCPAYIRIWMAAEENHLTGA